MKYEVAGQTDVGKRRPHNEDNLLIADRVFVVADGMGGHIDGEVASQMLVDTFQRTLSALADPEAVAPWSVQSGLTPNENLIHGCIHWANFEIFSKNMSEGNVRVNRMGTTVVALMVGEDNVTVGHVGDSRIYRLRDGSLDQLTKIRQYSITSMQGISPRNR